MRLLTYFLYIIIIFLGLTFAVLNAEPVSVNYYVSQARLPLSILLVISFISGVFFTFIVAFIKIFQLKRENAKLYYQLKLIRKKESSEKK